MPKKLSQTEMKTYPECGTWGKTNHPEEQCWQGAGAHLKAKRNRPDDSSDNNPDSKAKNHNTISLRPATSPHQKRTIQKRTLPRLQHYHLVSDRQFVRSGLPTKVVHEYQQQLMGFSSVVRQQQMEKAKLITYNNTYLYQNPIPVWDPDNTTNFKADSGPFPQLMIAIRRTLIQTTAEIPTGTLKSITRTCCTSSMS